MDNYQKQVHQQAQTLISEVVDHTKEELFASMTNSEIHDRLMNLQERYKTYPEATHRAGRKLYTLRDLAKQKLQNDEKLLPPGVG